MKKYLLLLTVLFLWSCSSDDDHSETLKAQDTMNVSYGPDSEQTYDLYLPEGRSSSYTKVLILVHGGGWSAGAKEDMNYAVPVIKLQFPNYAIVNMNYRLATGTSPAYPKQTDDIASVIAHLESHSADYGISNQYAFFGVSAGAHLSMLYAYRFDTAHHVKAVCSVVGPTDFNDPAYADSELQTTLLPYLTGDITAEFLTEVSPVGNVSAQSPPTIQFLGNQDPLIPVTQGTRLEAALDGFGVSNELYYYEAGHGNFSIADTQDIYGKLG
ncbi:MAG TPA: alpha/beta hydrolase, partial [Flavobacterium sp.]|nr:alpha/beta hydrolase [Flavobacterium sp.]